MTINIEAMLPKTKLNHKRIGILGGSFDPPHLGHQLLALSVLALEPIDELWVIPCADHAFNKSLSSFEERLKLCTLAFSRIKNLEVVAIENHLPTPSYTINTLEAIKKARPDLQLCLMLGSDLVPSFATWHEAQKLTKLYEIVIFERQSFNLSSLPPLLAHARLHQGYLLPNVKSTDLRRFFNEKKYEQSCPFLDRKVFAFIKNNGLYI